MSNDRVASIQAEVDGVIRKIVGGEFSDMMAVIKDNFQGRRFDGPSKAWVLSQDYNTVATILGGHGFLFEGGDDYQVPMEFDGDNDVGGQQSQLTAPVRRSREETSANTGGDFLVLRADEILQHHLLNIEEGIPGMLTGRDLAASMAVAMAFHKECEPDINDIYKLTIEAYNSNISLTNYYTWRDKNNPDGSRGKFNSHLKYNIVEDWLRITYGNDSIIHNFELNEEHSGDEREKYSQNALDMVGGCCLVLGKHAKDVAQKANELKSEYVKFLGDNTSLGKYREMQQLALTDAYKFYAIRVVYAVVAADEIYDVKFESYKDKYGNKKWRPEKDKDGNSIPKEDENGKYIVSRGFVKKARAFNWVVEKRAVVLLGKTMGDISFPENHRHSFSVKTVETLVDNPSLRALPDDNKYKVDAINTANDNGHPHKKMNIEETNELIYGSDEPID